MRDSYGARVQGVYDGGDDLLDLLARNSHRTVVHWWGRRIDGAKARAVCYICDTYIVSWAAKFPPTVGAVDKIKRHRDEHLAALAVPHQAIGGTR